jgi:hypothetical protein
MIFKKNGTRCGLVCFLALLAGFSSLPALGAKVSEKALSNEKIDLPSKLLMPMGNTLFVITAPSFVLCALRLTKNDRPSKRRMFSRRRLSPKAIVDPDH